MYASVEAMKIDQERLGTQVMAQTRRFTTKKGVVGPSDWYMKEFSRETLAYFKSNQMSDIDMPKFGSEDKQYILEESRKQMDALLKTEVNNKSTDAAYNQSSDAANNTAL